MRVAATAIVALVLGSATGGSAAAGTTEIVPGSPRVGSGDRGPGGRFVGFTVTFCAHNAGCGSSGSVIDRQTGVESGGCFEGDDNNVAGISRDGRFVLCK